MADKFQAVVIGGGPGGYVCAIRLAQLGLQKIYPVYYNPLPWLDAILNAPEHTNFFENRVTEYTRSATKGTWEEAFN